MEDNYDISPLKKKKRKNSRAKGSTFERHIAKILNHRFKTTEFSRSPGSGAFATTHTLPEHLKIYGDLITPQNFKYCIECKKGYNNLNLYSLYNYSSEWWSFLDQCRKDSEKCGRIPMVIFKQDRQPVLCIIPDYVKTLERLQYIEIHKIENFNRVAYRIYRFADILADNNSTWLD